MLKYLISFLSVFALLASLSPGWAGNSLKHHPSPYLAMHAEDPVDWQLWNEAVFKKAREENKLIFVSVGYFSCHWCHVMQRESYQDEGIGETLNEHFLAVKIDRELRPELDKRLIDFVSRVRGSAGWPLNVFLTPEGYPLTGFTYLPKDIFFEALLQLQQQWITRREQINAAANEYYLATLADEASNELLPLPGVGVENLASSFVLQAMQIADELQGGFGESSKFPQNPQLQSLMRLVKQGQNVHPGLVEFIHLSLRTMASLNLMDHVNGGFFRYTTDPDWQTPHYEKMLYDNAQMVVLYLEAEKLWPGKGYAQVAEQTLAFVEKHMKHPQGGYVSSLSAVDVNDIEGGSYLWQRQQLASVLEKGDLDYLDKLWALKESSEHLLPPMVGIGAAGDSKRNQTIRKKLQQIARPIMPVDDKRLASWNALMLQALVAAADYDDRYLDAAREQFEFMRDTFVSDYQLIRFAGNAELAETTFEDYAFVAQAFNLYAALTDDRTANTIASRLVVDAFEYFFVDRRWVSNRQSLMPTGSGQWLIQDAVIPSALGQWLDAALTMPTIKTEIKREAKAVIQRQTRNMLDTPYYYGSLIALRHRLGL